MNFEDENALFKKGLEEKEKGNYDDAVYYLDWAVFVSFAKGDLEKIKEIEKIISELKYKTDYSSHSDFFIKITNLMLKKEKLPDNIFNRGQILGVDVIGGDFFEAVEGIEWKDSEYKFVGMALKRIVEYMESINQGAPKYIKEYIEKEYTYADFDEELDKLDIKDWTDLLYEKWIKGCKFYNKMDYKKAMKYFHSANTIFIDNVPEYEYYEIREDAYKKILNNNIKKGIKKFIWFIEGILSSGDYYNLSGELETIASIFTKIGRYDIAKCFLNRGAEEIYKDIKDTKPKYILKEVLNFIFSDVEREEILNNENSLKKLFKGKRCYFNVDYFDFMMIFFIDASNWMRFLEVYEDFKNKIENELRNYQISDKTANKIIIRFEKSMSNLLLIAYLLNGNYEKCLYYIELFEDYYGLDEFDEIEKNKINLIADIADSLNNNINKKEEWLNKLNKIYEDILNQQLKSTYKEVHRSNVRDILDYWILKEFLNKS